MVYIGTLYAALLFNLPPAFVAFGVLFGGAAMFMAHAVCFIKMGLRFGRVTEAGKTLFNKVIKTFIPSLFGVSIVEVNMFVGGVIASYLPKGSVSLIYYSSRFRHIPVGIFGVALATTLLPHFSRLVLYAPSRLNFYLLEVIKFVTWLILPVSFFLIFVSHNFFSFVLLSGNASPEQINHATGLFIVFVFGLLFVCINKALLSMLYALKDTRSAMMASGISAVVNIVGDIIGMLLFGTYGIVAASVMASASLTGTLLWLLYTKHNIVCDISRYKLFVQRYVVELGAAVLLFGVGFYGLLWMIQGSGWEESVRFGYGYWVVVMGLGGVVMLGLWFAGKRKVYFIN
jgi:putative peptidoglycan lipid II flippase